MKINSIRHKMMPPIKPDSVTFGAKIKIPRKINMDNLYMYNDVLDIMKECKVGGVISNDGVRIDTHTENITNTIINKLKKIKIKFISD